MLLGGVEETVEGLGGEADRFGEEGREVFGEVGHFLDVGFVDGAEEGEEGGRGPLVWGEEVVVEGGGGGGDGVRGGEVELFAPVRAGVGGFVAEFAVACIRC